MEKEHLILSYIEQEENTTQRDIARDTGMGLGTVNLLLKKMMNKGLVKIERLNAKSIRYMLTPKGLKEKTEKTYKYIKRSYDHIMTVSNAVGERLQSADIQKADVVYLYGPQNEVYEIVKMALQQQKGLNYEYVGEEEPPGGGEDVVLVWRLEDEEQLSPRHNVINLLKKL